MHLPRLKHLSSLEDVVVVVVVVVVVAVAAAGDGAGSYFDAAP